MNKEQLIEKWEKEIADLDKIIQNQDLVGYMRGLYKGIHKAISEKLMELKNLDVEPDKRVKKCQNEKILKAQWCDKHIPCEICTDYRHL